ncbi:conserved hypothetical protein [Burkholderia gladioli]|uniref:Uncharacterized protein n=1 Tax=Burkholderia gladioli (strain BSR3) TaxID=999541 RepID=F2L9C4_BURGS|nr:hypothetical protein [Burkholderia gladioli]AEA59518.1 hypothetical protein bgla_1g08300 [Burkholderia gladioli BSR3]MBW5284925.1 hypothetical protein [Burkholderia gladioli]CAG9240121.1 conserved hypothetical protein [Burkholderia gladioli]
MRTTKATHAVERLKTRTGNPRYAAVSVPGDLFYLTDRASGRVEKLCAPLPPDEFVAFVNSLSPPAPRKASKLDEAFEDKIRKAKG